MATESVADVRCWYPVWLVEWVVREAVDAKTEVVVKLHLLVVPILVSLGASIVGQRCHWFVIVLRILHVVCVVSEWSLAQPCFQQRKWFGKLSFDWLKILAGTTVWDRCHVFGYRLPMGWFWGRHCNWSKQFSWLILKLLCNRFEFYFTCDLRFKDRLISFHQFCNRLYTNLFGSDWY